jgi:YggT family protein
MVRRGLFSGSWEGVVAGARPLGYGRPMLALLWVLRILSILVIAEAILSWVQPAHQSPRRELSRITNPLYAPIRALIPPGRLGGLDISPLIVLLLIQLASRAVIGIAYAY